MSNRSRFKLGSGGGLRPAWIEDCKEGMDLRGYGSEAKQLSASGHVWSAGGIGKERLSEQGIRHSSAWHTLSPLWKLG